MTDTQTRAGFVALIGEPNAGKSTLLNRMVGAKVSIVTHKVQTTRARIRGIAIAGVSQIVFVDTPGIFRPRRRLDRSMVAAAWGVIALHVVGAPLLMWHRTRLAVFLIYCVFHCANAWFFNIGIFPWLTIVATTIFFAPDWPSALFGRAAPIRPAPAPLLPRAALLAMAVWIAVQIFLPVRGALFDSETRWSGDGHRFSWRMRIYDREAEGVFIVTDHRTGQFWEVDPEEFLSRRQAGTMMTRADLIHQFANHLARIWRERGHEVAVYAEICKSLNGRPCQYYIAPGTDLTQVRINPFGADPWVLPLEEPAWGAADNRRLYGGT